ncbi:MAG TPA: hypothetical protein VF475_17725 [Sphingobium sp.]
MLANRGWTAAGALALLLSAAAPAHAAPDPVVGRWRAAEGPEMASQLELTEDGHFRYVLSYGALDEEAQGRWTRTGTLVALTTEPQPKPSAILLDSMSPTSRDGAALFLIVAGPGTPAGKGIAGIDFRIEFDSGEPMEGYTQDYGWQADSLSGRTPRWVQLFEPIHGIASARIAIPPGTRAMSFRFEGNDYGIADFRAAPVRVDGDRLTLMHRMGTLHYARVKAGD